MSKVEESKVKFKSKRRKASSGKKEIMRSVNKEKVAERKTRRNKGEKQQHFCPGKRGLVMF